VIACGWHGWEFDVRTGSAVVTGSRYKVRTYSVRVEDGRVLVDVQRRKREAGSMGS
jgi:nitrite reductase/ring-hydroxylating ferredoxin subunit